MVRIWYPGFKMADGTVTFPTSIQLDCQAVGDSGLHCYQPKEIRREEHPAD
jgi:hypothetical protein